MPERDYRNFRIGWIRREKYSHLILLLFWPVYILCYVLLERIVDPGLCHIVQCALDDRVTFCEWFLIPYVFWYVCLLGITVYTLVYDVVVFRSFMKYLILTAAVAFACYVFYPNRQILRPETFSRENGLIKAVSILYRLDTATNVCPSLHVLHGFGILFAGLRAKGLEGYGWQCFFVIVTVLVCLSTVFLRQHSVIDGIAALPISVGAEWICFGGFSWVRCSKRKTV